MQPANETQAPRPQAKRSKTEEDRQNPAAPSARTTAQELLEAVRESTNHAVTYADVLTTFTEVITASAERFAIKSLIYHF